MARVSVQVPIDEPTEPIEQPEAPVAAVPSAAVKQASFRLTKKQLILGLAGIAGLMVIILLFSLLSDRNHLKQEVNKLSTNQTTTNQNDAQKYQDEIGKIVELPSGQTPSLIPVKDAKGLAAQNPFFKNAQDGDVVLLYVYPDKSVRAILYRPSTHKVVEATSSATVGSGTTAPKP